MKLMDPGRCTLLIVDFQLRLMPAIHDSAPAIANAARLLETARLLDVPVVTTEQNPKGLGTTVPALAGAGTLIEKMSFGAAAEPAFLAAIGSRPDLVVTGCEAHVCVLQTVLGLLDLGRRVFVVRDAIGSRRAESKETAVARMARHGAEIVTAEMVVFEWLRSAEHEKFRAVSTLVR
jgi:nicotinamidase-related amidase